MSLSPSEIDAFLAAKIPLSVAMQVRVADWDGERLVLTAPLAPNVNHIGTAFGGSIQTLATFAAYTLIWLLLEDREAHVVIRQGETNFLRPIQGQLLATCQRPEDASAFIDAWRRKGKARLNIEAEVSDGAEGVALFRGVFVALKKN